MEYVHPSQDNGAPTPRCKDERALDMSRISKKASPQTRSKSIVKLGCGSDSVSMKMILLLHAGGSPTVCVCVCVCVCLCVSVCVYECHCVQILVCLSWLSSPSHRQSVCPVCLSARPSVCLSVCLSLCVFLSFFLCLLVIVCLCLPHVACVCSSFCPLACLFVCLSMSFCLSGDTDIGFSKPDNTHFHASTIPTQQHRGRHVNWGLPYGSVGIT